MGKESGNSLAGSSAQGFSDHNQGVGPGCGLISRIIWELGFQADSFGCW